MGALQHNPFSVPKLPSGVNYKACLLVKTLEVLSSCSEERKSLRCHDELQSWTVSKNVKLEDRFKDKAIKEIEHRIDKFTHPTEINELRTTIVFQNTEPDKIIDWGFLDDEEEE